MLAVVLRSAKLPIVSPIVAGRTDGRSGGGGGGMRRTGLITFGSGGGGRDAAECRSKIGLFDSASDPVDSALFKESFAT